MRDRAIAGPLARLRSLSAFVLTTLAVLILDPTTVQAAHILTSITYTPSPIPLGALVTYTANDNNSGGTPSYTWRYRCVTGTSTGNWVTAGSTAKTLQLTESVPGTYDVECRAVWPPDSGDPSGADSTVSTQVTIPQATEDDPVLGLGLGVTTPVGSSNLLTVKFALGAGGMDVIYISGTPQERIRRPHADNFDSGWVNGDGVVFYLMGGAIYDKKYFVPGTPAGWANFDAAPNGTIVDHFYQQNRIVTTDACSHQIVMTFQERHFAHVKNGYRQWSLVEI